MKPGPIQADPPSQGGDTGSNHVGTARYLAGQGALVNRCPVTAKASPVFSPNPEVPRRHAARRFGIRELLRPHGPW